MRDYMDDDSTIRARRRGQKDNEAVQSLVGRLQNEADERVRHRATIEQRWVEDLEYYHGQYEETAKRRLKGKNRSSVFVNITRPKTDALSARLMDLLFPTDDRHWGIQPTPVPEMDTASELLTADMEAARSKLKAADNAFAEVANVEDMGAQEASPQLVEAGQAQDAAQAEVDEIQAAMDDLAEAKKEARRRANLMQEEMDDQLKACSYKMHCRDVIEDACKIGMGVMKGPVLSPKTHRRWTKGDDYYEYAEVNDLRPAFERVDPWSFFWDHDARTVEESEGFYERHLMNKKQLRKLARRHGMDKEAIRCVIKDDPRERAPGAISQLHSITNDDTHQIKGKYQVWEYTGPLEPDDLAMLADVYEDGEMAEVLGEVDPLEEINVKIWFCQGEVFSFALHPLDSDEPIYSVFNIVKSETGLAGYGVPRMVRDQQSIINATWRLQMDNAAVAAGPQVIVNKSRLQPMDGSGDYSLTPFKVWEEKTGDASSPAFQLVEIPMNQALLANIIAMARQDADEVSGLPQIAQGEQGAGVTKTAQGMAILMNSANVVLRRYVKNWDDDITVPGIRRLYDFNMQFSDKEEIKGDYEVDARGSSVLLVREMQAPNLMNMAQTFNENPRFDDWIDDEGLMREVFKAHMIPSDGILLSKREHDENMRKKAEAPQSNPEMYLKMAELEDRKQEREAKLAIAQMESEARRYVADRNFEADMQKYAHTSNLKAEEIDAKRDDKREERELKQQNMAIEVAMQKRTGKSAGGNV